MTQDEKLEVFEKEYVRNYNKEPELSEKYKDILLLIFKPEGK